MILYWYKNKINKIFKYIFKNNNIKHYLYFIYILNLDKKKLNK